MKCRHCKASLEFNFLDLGFSPPSNGYLSEEDLNRHETYYPLRVNVCHKCWLVQTEDYIEPDIFFNPSYTYLSSTSKTWLDHAANYSQMVIQRFDLNETNFVVEIASNDGYLLKNFTDKKIPCLGIEPASNAAAISENLGIPVINEFFGNSLANELRRKNKLADLIIGNNVYAHVPDINDFTKGLKVLLKPEGVITLEFPHILNLMDKNQFDTIYHEHYSYLSLNTVKNIFESEGLKIWDVEFLSTHGGSLRIYAGHTKNSRNVSERVLELLAKETDRGLQRLQSYRAFQMHADRIKNELLIFLIDKKKSGKVVVAYGAAAKGNTLLNYAGVKPDLLAYVCDAALSKQGKYMPGSHIPIFAPEILRIKRPDYILILPWNLSSEIRHQLKDMADHGVKFVTAVPELKIYEA